MRFIADMGISPVTVLFLRNSGQEAVHLHELNLDTMPDSEILEKARRENSILLTCDLDFGELLAARGYELPSVIIFRLKNLQPENVNRHLTTILKRHEDLLKAGVLLSVTEKRIRARKLPIYK
jgi:predicted nuclease of predicted toxin-antitoxin system